MWTSCKMSKSHRKSPVTVWALSQDHVERLDLVMKGVYIHCALNQLSLTVPNEPHGPPLNPNDLHWASLTPTVPLLSTTDTHWPSLTTPITPLSLKESHWAPLSPAEHNWAILTHNDIHWLIMAHFFSTMTTIWDQITLGSSFSRNWRWIRTDDASLN